MIYFKKLFKFPSPKDLGMSNHHNAMAMDFDNKEETVKGEPTWAKYYNYLRKTYPVKYFFASTLPSFMYFTWQKSIGWKLRDFKWWFESFIIRRDHLLDLRQPKSADPFDADYYRHGWIEPDTKMVYAIFNILNEYIEKSESYCPTLEECEEEPALKEQRDQYIEARTIHYWWNVARKQNLKKEKDLLLEWSKAKRNNSANEKELFKAMNILSDNNDKELDEMLIRILKIRRSFWS